MRIIFITFLFILFSSNFSLAKKNEKITLEEIERSVLDLRAKRWKKFMDETQIFMKKRKPMVLLSGSIFASAVFIGSAFLFQSNEYLGFVGLISSGLIMAVSGLFRKH